MGVPSSELSCRDAEVYSAKCWPELIVRMVTFPTMDTYEDMRFKGLDLNLLVALDALMTKRSVTAAARSINLSQPAMSAAIARLRTYFGDELFSMQGRELVPTPR
ncbi:regulatory helix-turn-helix protein, lysR family, partial [Rhizobium tibeticum]